MTVQKKKPFKLLPPWSLIRRHLGCGALCEFEILLRSNMHLFHIICVSMQISEFILLGPDTLSDISENYE